MNKLPLVLLCLPLFSALAQAQAPVAGVAEASAAATKPGEVVERSFQIRFLGNQLTMRGAMLNRLSAMLTDNLGSMQYCAETGILKVSDTPPVLDRVMRELADRDLQPAQIFIDVKIVQLADPKTVERVLAGTGQTREEGAAVLQQTQLQTVLASLKSEKVEITQAPKLVALADQTCSIFIGDGRRDLQATADGGASAPLDADTLDLSFTPTIEPGTKRVRLSLQMRSLLAAQDGSILSRHLAAASGDTLVFQQFAASDRGAMVFVTPTIIHPAITTK